MIRLGIANQETWGFFNEIYASLKTKYITSKFQRRIWPFPVLRYRLNELLFRQDLQSFMRSNDVVFFEWASELLMIATHLPKVCPIVTRLHRYELYDWADRINWDAVDRIILVSKAKQREFISKFPEQAQKTVVLFPSTSLEKFSLQPKEYAGDIGILCHLTPRKRVYDLILSFSELIQRDNNFHLHIAGASENAYRDHYTALLYLIKSLDLEDKVTLYGNVSDPWNWYHNIDIFISNSFSEGLQVAPMEAMASGCFCLSHHWDGAEELLPPENLFFTSGQFVEKVLDYSILPGERKQAERERMRVLACETFDINRTAEGIINIIEDTVKTKTR